MGEWAFATICVTLIVTVLIFNLYSLKNAKDPKEELLNAKRLLDQGLIESGEYEKVKVKLLRRIVAD